MSKSAKLRRPSAKMERRKCENATSSSHEINFFFFLSNLSKNLPINLHVDWQACMQVHVYKSENRTRDFFVCGDLLYRTYVLQEYNSKKEMHTELYCINIRDFSKCIAFFIFFALFYLFSLLFHFVSVVFTGHRVRIKFSYIIFL